MDFEDWIIGVIDYANEIGMPSIAENIAQYSFMYEDYFEQGMSQREAFEAEWGA